MINGTANGKAQILNNTLCEKNVITEAAGDFTLPDYQNEIRRILHVFPTVLPPTRYVNGSSAEFSGTVDYQVLYIGADGGVYCAPLSSDYAFSVPLEGEGNVFAHCTVSAESVNTRVSAPRRMSIRTKLRANVRAYGEVECSLDVGEEINPTTVYTKTQRCMSCAPQSSLSDVIDINYICPLPTEDTRVISAEAKPVILGSSAAEGTVMCTGELVLRLFCVREESGEYSTVESRAPFDGEIDIEGCSDTANIRTRGHVAQMSVEVTDAGIECNVGVLLEGICFCSEEREYIDDVYSSERECECSLRTVSAREVAYCDTSSFTLSERMPLGGASLSDDAEILLSSGTATVDKCSISEGRCIFGGNAVFTMLCKREEEIFCTDITVPIRYECACPSRHEAASFDCFAQILDCRVKISEGNLCIDAEISLSADVLCECAATFANRAVFGEYIDASEGELIVCYPTSDDTAWSVAKRYSVAPSAVIGNPSTDKYVIIE